MKYPIIFKEIEELGLDKIYDLTGIMNQYGGKDLDSESESKILEESESKTLEEPDFEKYCENYQKLPHILPPRKRIICLGDLHGDYKLTIDCLKLAKVINDELEWVADPKDTAIVQIGDQIDRCRPEGKGTCAKEGTTPDDEGSDIKIMEFLTDLHKKASKVGGAVFSLLGNHEILNVDGKMDYVSYEGLKQFEGEINPETKEKFKSGKEARKYFFKRGNKYANFMACTRQTAMIIGSNIFVHATIMPELAEKFKVEDLNILIRKWLLNLINTTDKVEGIGNIGDILLNYNISPFWPRMLGNLPPNIALNDNEDCQQYLLKTLELYECNNMIVGHTPQAFAKDKAGINATCRDKTKDGVNKGVWRVDVGSSTGFDNFKTNKKHKENSRAQVLEILNDNTFKVLG